MAMKLILGNVVRCLSPVSVEESDLEDVHGRGTWTRYCRANWKLMVMQPESDGKQRCFKISSTKVRIWMDPFFMTEGGAVNLV